MKGILSQGKMIRAPVNTASIAAEQKPQTKFAMYSGTESKVANQAVKIYNAKCVVSNESDL